MLEVVATTPSNPLGACVVRLDMLPLARVQGSTPLRSPGEEDHREVQLIVIRQKRPAFQAVCPFGRCWRKGIVMRLLLAEPLREIVILSAVKDLLLFHGKSSTSLLPHGVI